MNIHLNSASYLKALCEQLGLNYKGHKMYLDTITLNDASLTYDVKTTNNSRYKSFLLGDLSVVVDRNASDSEFDLSIKNGIQGYTEQVVYKNEYHQSSPFNNIFLQDLMFDNIETTEITNVDSLWSCEISIQALRVFYD